MWDLNEEDYMMQQMYHQQEQLLQQQLEESKMDKYVQKAGTVSLFNNDKEGNDKRPDYTGNLKTPDGKEFKISLWNSVSQKGTNYLSGKVDIPYNPNGDAPSQGSASDAVPF
tara:strand:- start:212 stop:547 length:336 start_codon:yes stop_codon:yes gene_type:complete